MKRRASFCCKTCVWKYKSKKYYSWHSFTVATHLPWLFAVKICRSYLPWEFAVAICRGNLPWLFAVRICCGYLPWVSCICNQILFGICKQILFISKQTFFRCEQIFFICEMFFVNGIPFCYCRGSYGPPYFCTQIIRLQKFDCFIKLSFGNQIFSHYTNFYFLFLI